MTSETDCSSSSTSSEMERKRKLHKKLERKAEKKSKIHKKNKKKKNRKKKKLPRKESTSSSDENLKIEKPKSEHRTELIKKNDNKEDTFGPALPPHLLNEVKKFKKSEEPLVIGPVIPKELLESNQLLYIKTEAECNDESKNIVTLETDEDDMQGFYGPLPVANKREMSSVQIELEQRALELKMAAIEGTSTAVSDQNVREEWMLELPNVGLKGGLAALTNLKRGFHQGKEKPDFSDRSSWTKTPHTGNEKQNPTTSKISKEQLEQQALALYEKQRDAEQEAIAKKHKKKHKRKESLVEMHQKKLRKDKKKKEKELNDSGAKPERRPFTRDIDLKLNKIDRSQTKQIVDKAKILHTKFSTGQSKYL